MDEYSKAVLANLLVWGVVWWLLARLCIRKGFNKTSSVVWTFFVGLLGAGTVLAVFSPSTDIHGPTIGKSVTATNVAPASKVTPTVNIPYKSNASLDLEQGCRAIGAFAEAAAISRDNGVPKENVVSDSMTLFAGSTVAQNNAHKFINAVYDNPTVTSEQSNQAAYQLCIATGGT